MTLLAMVGETQLKIKMMELRMLGVVVTLPTGVATIRVMKMLTVIVRNKSDLVEEAEEEVDL